MTLSQKSGSNILESVYSPILSTLTFFMEGFNIWRNCYPMYVDENKDFNLKNDIFLFLNQNIYRWYLKDSDYDQEISQSQLQTNPWHREEEPHNNHETL